jgi:hypothetical protein
MDNKNVKFGQVIRTIIKMAVKIKNEADDAFY